MSQVNKDPLPSKKSRPVDNDRDWHHAGLLLDHVDKEPLAIGHHVVHGPSLIGGQRREVEQGPRGADIDTIASLQSAWTCGIIILASRRISARSEGPRTYGF